MLRLVLVVCLAWSVKRATPCCQPDQYSANYDMIVDVNAPLGDDGGMTRIVIKANGRGKMDWENKAFSDELTGKVSVPVTEDHIMDFDNTAKMGMITEGGNTKIWLQGSIPAMRVETCKYVELIGGIPENYQCLMNFYEQDGNTYTAPMSNPFMSEKYTVDENCAPTKQSIFFKPPPEAGVAPSVNMTATLYDIELSATDIDNEVPEGCQLHKQVALPPYQKGMPGFMIMMMGMLAPDEEGGQGGMGGGGPGRGAGGPHGAAQAKRSLHHAVMEELAKRSLQQYKQKRAVEHARQQRALHRMVRNLKNIF